MEGWLDWLMKCFMIHSLVSKYTDVICVIAVNSLDAEKLQEHFCKIMAALRYIVCAMGISLDNSVVKR